MYTDFVSLLCFSLIITALFDSVVIVQNYRFLKYKPGTRQFLCVRSKCLKSSLNYLQLL